MMAQLSSGQIKKYLKQLRQRQEQYVYFLGQLAFQAAEQGKLEDPGVLDAYNTLKEIQEQIAQWESQLEQMKAEKTAARQPKCPYCGAAIFKGALYCPSCGASLAPQQAATAPAAAAPPGTAAYTTAAGEAAVGRRCPNCGAPLDEEAVFCGNCGARVAEETGTGGDTGQPPFPPAAEPSQATAAMEERPTPPQADAAQEKLEAAEEGAGEEGEGQPPTAAGAVPQAGGQKESAEEGSQGAGEDKAREDVLRCPSCGTEISDREARFCPECGTKVRE
ncbi:MAG: zinc-ribbon domain-containing protein [Actinomycetota bacterium]